MCVSHKSDGLGLCDTSKLASISDVAKLSGLSVSTVSRVINNKPHVAEYKRQKVLEAMEQLSYTPLQAARQLRGSGSGNIAVAVPTITNSFFAHLVNAIERTCRQADYRTLITQTNGEASGEEAAMELLKMQHADGLILCSIENEWERVKSYAKYGALVVCDEYNDDDSVSMFFGKQYDGFYGATQYLIGRGYKKIAYCTGTHYLNQRPKGSDLDSDRFRGYLDALKANHLTAEPKWYFREIHTLEDGHGVLRRILAQYERPDAIIAGSDEVAAGMEMEALKCGLRVPEDLAILGVDDQPLASVLPVPLTTIRQPTEEVGTLAAQEMVAQLTGRSKEPHRRALYLELIVRGSA